MNTPDHDHPALTAYALGELSPAEALTIQRMIATDPEVRAEYERVAQTVTALRNAPAIPRRTLSQRQRETVLAMGQTPARSSAKIISFPQAKRSAMWTFAKFAAAACLAIGAFVLGQKFAPHASQAVANATEPAKENNTVPVVAPAPQIAVTPAAPQPKTEIAPRTNDAATFEVVQQPPRIAPALVVSAPVAPVEKVAAPKIETPAPASSVPPITKSPVQNGETALKAFALVKAQQESTIAITPKLMRAAAKPVPREFAGQLLAAPVAELPPVKNNKPVKPDPQPPLVIHSWKAETASCPWDSSRRLMRIVAQIPVDQDGVETNSRDYQLSLKFDPAQVQAWRLITEKHMPATGGNLATRFAWYEIIPARNFAPNRDKPAALGTLDIVQPRGPARDSQPLKLLDRGLAWDEAREDFVFETAMVGFNLLLQGRENIGSLNHKLVIELAEQSKGDDPGGQRDKFIKAVKQAQKAAGL